MSALFIGQVYRQASNVMAKYRDKTTCKLPAEVVKFKKGEHPKIRHGRRLNENKEQADKLRNYCRSNGWGFDIKNEGHHWQMRRGDIIIDWFPATAKFIVNQQWTKGIHVHDITQVKSYLGFARLLGI